MEFTVEELSKRATVLQNAADELISRHKELTSLKEAAIWKSDASAFQELVDTYQEDVFKTRQKEKGLLEQVEARKNLPFIRFLSALRNAEKKIEDNLRIIQEIINNLEVAENSLSEIMDELPTNKLDRKIQINDLSIQKKELVLEKRTINEDMRQIRTEAKQSRTQLAGIRGGTLGKVAKYSRATITYNAERRLAPLATRKGELESELVEIQGKIKRLKALRVGVKFTLETNVLRCAYCGRRVNDGEACPACGSDQTYIA